MKVGDAPKFRYTWNMQINFDSGSGRNWQNSGQVISYQLACLQRYFFLFF